MGLYVNTATAANLKTIETTKKNYLLIFDQLMATTNMKYFKMLMALVIFVWALD